MLPWHTVLLEPRKHSSEHQVARSCALRSNRALSGVTSSFLRGCFRFRLTSLWVSALPSDANCAEVAPEVASWADVWASLHQWRCEQFEATQAEYPAFIPEMFSRQLHSMSVIFARFITRNCATFCMYYRPFVQELWTKCRMYPVPRHLVYLD